MTLMILLIKEEHIAPTHAIPASGILLSPPLLLLTPLPIFLACMTLQS